jgi:hypothetical protein
VNRPLNPLEENTATNNINTEVTKLNTIVTVLNTGLMVVSIWIAIRALKTAKTAINGTEKKD